MNVKLKSESILQDNGKLWQRAFWLVMAGRIKDSVHTVRKWRLL